MIALIEVMRSTCPIVNHIRASGADARVERLISWEHLTLYRIVAKSNPEAVGCSLRKFSKNIMRVGKDRFWVESKPCLICKYFASLKVPVLSTETIDGNMVYEVLIQSPGKLRILERGLRKIGMKLIILSSYSRSSMELTDRQWEIIKKAYEEGYFDHDRKTSLTTMAREIGISPAGLSDIMRRGVEKIVQDYLRNR